MSATGQERSVEMVIPFEQWHDASCQLSCLPMRRKNSTLPIRLYLIGAFILLAGLVVASLVYLTAADGRSDAVGNQIAGGNAYGIAPRDSKEYLVDLENIGGQAAVLVDDFIWWFSDLWHGRRLPYTLAALAIGVALACFLAARLLSKHPSHGRTEDQDG